MTKVIDLERIKEVYFKNHGKFWVLHFDEEIIGTIALQPLTKYYELKRFFILYSKCIK